MKIAIKFPTKNTFEMLLGKQANKKFVNKPNLLFQTAIY